MWRNPWRGGFLILLGLQFSKCEISPVDTLLLLTCGAARPIIFSHSPTFRKFSTTSILGEVLTRYISGFDSLIVMLLGGNSIVSRHHVTRIFAINENEDCWFWRSHTLTNLWAPAKTEKKLDLDSYPADAAMCSAQRQYLNLQHHEPFFYLTNFGTCWCFQ